MISTIVVSLLSALTLAIVTSAANAWQRSREKKLDWDREDKKEAEKERKRNEVADRLLKSDAEARQFAISTAKETNAKLEVIRVDVNSNMTAAMKAELDAIEGQVALLREVVELKRARGTEPTESALAFIAAKDDRINELKATLKDRLNHTDKVAKEEASKA